MFSLADVPEKDPPDVLNEKKCLEYLAALRHAKWFQVNSSQDLELCLSCPRELVISIIQAKQDGCYCTEPFLS